MKNLLNLIITSVVIVISCFDLAEAQSNPTAPMLDSLHLSRLWFDSTSSGGWKFKWSTDIMLAINDTTQTVDTLFVNESVPETDTSIYFFDENYKLLSIVGPYVSLSYSYNGSGGVHPICGTCYETYVPGSSDRVSLADLFDEDDIQHALLADTLIQSHLTKKAPKDLNDLVNNLDGGCEMDLGDILTSFAVGAIDSDSVTINFGITHGCELMRGNFTELTIRLPIPDDNRQMFVEARKNQTVGW